MLFSSDFHCLHLFASTSPMCLARISKSAIMLECVCPRNPLHSAFLPLDPGLISPLWLYVLWLLCSFVILLVLHACVTPKRPLSSCSSSFSFISLYTGFVSHGPFNTKEFHIPSLLLPHSRSTPNMDFRNFRHTDATSQKTQSSSSSSQDLENEKIDPRLERPSPWERKRLWIVMLSTLIVFALVLGLSLGLTLDHKSQCNATCSSKYPVVDLGYAKYQGTSSPAGIKQWLGMRYAAPPVGDLRFAAPQDPVKEDKIIKASKVCLSR